MAPFPLRFPDAFDAEKPIGAIFLAALMKVNTFELLEVAKRLTGSAGVSPAGLPGLPK
jgi:hypothetical protein